MSPAEKIAQVLKLPHLRKAPEAWISRPPEMHESPAFRIPRIVPDSGEIVLRIELSLTRAEAKQIQALTGLTV